MISIYPGRGEVDTRKMLWGRSFLGFAIFWMAWLGMVPALWADTFLTPPASDRSVYYLTQIFGTIDASVLGIAGGPPLMGALFKVFNHAVLVLGSIFVTFYTAVGIINTSGTGKFLGEREHNALWKPVRMAMGVILLLPKSTGYNWVQVGFMWVILQGIGAADKIWDAALYYFSQGGGVLVNSSTGIDTKKPWEYRQKNWKVSEQVDPLSKYLTEDISAKTVKAVRQLISNMICVKLRGKDNYTMYLDTPTQQQTVLLGSGSQVSPSLTDPSAVPNLVFGPEGVCGTMKLPEFTGSVADSHVRVVNNMQRAFIESMPVLQQIAPAFIKPALQNSCFEPGHASTPKNCNPDGLTPDSGFVQQSLIAIFTNVAAAVQNGLVDYVSQTDQPVSLEGQALYHSYQEMQKDGWIFAGNYYNDLVGKGTSLVTKLNGMAQDAVIVTGPLDSVIRSQDIGDDTTALSWVDTARTAMNKNADGTRGLASSTGTNTTANKSAVLEAMGFSKVTQLANGSAVWSTWSADNTLGNPVAHLAFRGWQYMRAAEVTLLLSPLILFIFGATLGIGSPYNPAPHGVSAAINFASTLMVMVLGTLYMEGVLLAKYVPLIPFMMYMAAALGWMMIVFEAMIAAPVVALGAIYHEGHDMFGKAEPAVMLIMSVFLRPSLMVLGFIGAMLFTHVAMDMLNIVFTTAMSQTGLTAFGFLVNLALYTTLVIGVMNKVFSLIYQVPDKVLRWIGDTSQGVGGAEEMMHTVKASAESVGRSASQPFGDYARSMGQLAHKGGNWEKGNQSSDVSATISTKGEPDSKEPSPDSK